jgi:hypothetical protein
MSQDEIEQILPGWQAASQAVAQELAAWPRAHPRATLTEIEGVVFETMQKLQAQALGDVVQASSSADLAAQPAPERPHCPRCGGQLEPRAATSSGTTRSPTRRAARRAQLRGVRRVWHRSFPPLDEELELLPRELSATLAEGVVRLATKLPFAQAAEEVAFFWGVQLEESTVRRHTQPVPPTSPNKPLIWSDSSTNARQRQTDPPCST